MLVPCPTGALKSERLLRRPAAQRDMATVRNRHPLHVCCRLVTFSVITLMKTTQRRIHRIRLLRLASGVWRLDQIILCIHLHNRARDSLGMLSTCRQRCVRAPPLRAKPKESPSSGEPHNLVQLRQLNKSVIILHRHRHNKPPQSIHSRFPLDASCHVLYTSTRT